jgi:hypothetical protein
VKQTARAFLGVAVLLSSGCARTNPAGPDASPPAGTDAARDDGRPPIIRFDADFDADPSDASGGSTPDANCGARSKTAARISPDVLIVLDRSGSMNDDINNRSCPGGTGCGPTSKWALMAPALLGVVRETEVDVNWGLEMFPQDITPVCSVSSTPAVGVRANNAAAIMAAIAAATSPTGGVVSYGNTPTRNAESSAATYLGTLTDNSPRYILLATDGLPTCPADGGTGTDDSAGATAAVADARAAGFSTFVVGIATAGSADGTLSDMARAGGLPRSGTPSYYAVASAADLTAAIRTLVRVTATCTFQIAPTPASDGSNRLDEIDVFGDGTAIRRDTTHADGYDYTDASMESIQIHGPLCEKILRGELREVTVTFRCIVS